MDKDCFILALHLDKSMNIPSRVTFLMNVKDLPEKVSVGSLVLLIHLATWSPKTKVHS
jgi:hypothetical protein